MLLQNSHILVLTQCSVHYLHTVLAYVLNTSYVVYYSMDQQTVCEAERLRVCTCVYTCTRVCVWVNVGNKEVDHDRSTNPITTFSLTRLFL